jgi:hypothetical protein
MTYLTYNFPLFSRTWYHFDRDHVESGPTKAVLATCGQRQGPRDQRHIHETQWSDQHGPRVQQ